MQVIQDSFNPTNAYHVFETPEEIAINSQLYDKTTMEPKPFYFFNDSNCYTNKNLLYNECNILEYPWAMMMREHNYQYYMQDNADPNYFYFITEINTSDQNQYFCKAQKVKNLGWKVVSKTSPDSGNRWGASLEGDTRSTYLHYKLIGQTSKYIIITQTHSGMSGNGAYTTYGRDQVFQYLCINKSSLSFITIEAPIVEGNNTTFIIKEFNDSIYVYEHIGNNGYISMIKPDSAQRVVIGTISDIGSWNSVGISNIILFRNKYYILTRNSSKDGYAFKIININFDAGSMSYTTKNLPAINGFPYHNATTRNDAYDGGWLQIDINNVDDQYISVTCHDNRNQYHGYGVCGKWGRWIYDTEGPWVARDKKSSSNAGYHRHAIYKYDSESDSWTGVVAIIPSNSQQHIYGVIYYNQYTPVFFLDDGVIAYKFDKNTETYTKCFEKPGIFYTVGKDEAGNLYTFNNSNVCLIYNDVTSSLLNAEFEKNSYTYNNADISTYIKIYSKNFINEYTETKVKIIIEGACYFTENGKKEFVTYTDISGVKNIPVTVTKSGTMYCYIKEVE